MTTDILGPIRHLIGSSYTDAVKPYILELTGLAIAVGPEDPSTADVRTDRVIIRTDCDGHITHLDIA